MQLEKELLALARRELNRRYGYTGPIGINYIELEDRILARAYFKSTKVRRMQDSDGVYRNYLNTKRGYIHLDDGVVEENGITLELVPQREVFPLVRKIR